MRISLRIRIKMKIEGRSYCKKGKKRKKVKGER